MKFLVKPVQELLKEELNTIVLFHDNFLNEEQHLDEVQGLKWIGERESAESWIERSESQKSIFVIIKNDDDNIIGYGIYAPSPEFIDCIHIYGLYIEKKARGNKLGTELAKYIVQTIKTNHPDKKICVGILGNNIIAQKTWANAGFNIKTYSNYIL